MARDIKGNWKSNNNLKIHGLVTTEREISGAINQEDWFKISNENNSATIQESSKSSTGGFFNGKN